MSFQTVLRLPVTGAFALPLAGYFVFLSLRVSLARIVHRVALGDTVPVPAAKKEAPLPLQPPPSSSSSSSPLSSTSATLSLSPRPRPSPGYDPLRLATRAHQNLAENLPLALVLAAVAELNGAQPGRLATALAVLFALRILHAEFGLNNRPDALGIGRPIGYYGTMVIVGWLAGWSAWLVYRG
ncbi:hypothetical protein Hte_004440 [Hypoxylon texense]